MDTSLQQDYVVAEEVGGESATLAIEAASRYFANIKASSPNSHQQSMAIQSLSEYLAASPPTGSKTIFEGFLSHCADCLQVCVVDVGCKVYELLLGVDLEDYRLRRPAVIKSMWEAVKSTSVDHHFEDIASSVRIKQLVVNAVEWEPYEVSDLMEHIAADCAGWIAGRGLETRIPRRLFAVKLLTSLLTHEFMRVSSSNVLRDLTVGSLWEALEHCSDTKLSEGLARLIATLVPLLASEVAHTARDDLIKAVSERITSPDSTNVLVGFLVLGSVIETGKIDISDEVHSLAMAHYNKMSTSTPMTGFVLGNLVKSFRNSGSSLDDTYGMVTSLIECFRLAVVADNNAPRASRGLAACLRFLTNDEAIQVSNVIATFPADTLRYIDLAQVVFLLLQYHRTAALSKLIPFIDRVGAECISNHNTTLSTPLWDIVMVMGQSEDGRHALLHRAELGAGCMELTPSSPVGLLRRGLLMMASGAIPPNYPLAMELLSHEHLEVRRRATLVSLRALNGLPVDTEGSLRIDAGVASMTERLLETGISDPNVSIRRLILSGLNRESCTVYLGLPDQVASVFMAYNDVDMACSDAALEILCRLLAHHPSSIHHGLDRIRTHLLKSVEETNQVAVVVNSVRQLKLMVKSRTFLSAVKQVEMVVVGKLDKRRRPLTHMLIADLFSLLSLCVHNGGTNHIDSVLILKQVLRYAKMGQSSFLRDAALKTLGELLRVHRADATTTGNSDVYRLLEGIIKDDENQGEKTRHMATDVLGIMGAVHPAKVRRMEQLANEQESLSLADPLAALKPPVRTNPRLLDSLPMSCLYFAFTAISSHTESRDAILNHLWRCYRETPSGLKITLIPQTVSLVLPYLAEPNVGTLHASALQILLDVAPLIRQSAYVAQGVAIINALSKMCGPGTGVAANLTLIMSLLDELARALPAEEMKHHRWAFHFIMSHLLNDVNDTDLVLAGVRSLESYAALMPVNDLKQAVLQVLECLSISEEREAVGSAHDARSLNSTFVDPMSLDSTVRSCSGVRADVAVADDYTGMTLVKLTCLDYVDIIITQHSQLAKELSALIVHKLIQFVVSQTNETVCDATMNTLASLFALTDKVCRPLMKLVVRQCGPCDHISSMEGFKAIEAFLSNNTPFSDPRAKLAAPAAPEESQRSNREWVIHSKLENATSSMVYVELKRMGIHPQHVQGLEVHPATDGGSEFTIRFTLSPKGEASCRKFAGDIANTASSFMTSLQVSSAKQKKDTMLPIPNSFMDPITRIPKAHRRRKEIMWINWLHRTTIALLEASPRPFLRALSPILREHNGLSRGLFPLAVASILKHISFERQRDLMSAFATALPVCPADVQQAIFEMAEFMECERDERTVEISYPYEDLSIVVERATPDDKFGINYDMTKSNKIIVSRLAAGGCGERAGVPLGAELVSLNGVAMKSTTELRSAIEGFTSISLVFRRRIPSEVFREQTFISTRTLAQVSTNLGLHAKAIYFNEQLMHKTLNYLASGAGTQEAQIEQTAALYRIVESLIATFQYVGFAMEAKGIVNFLSLLQQRNVIDEDTYSTFDEGSTLEKINWWEDASELYAERMAEDDESLLGAVRCWGSLGEVSNILAVTPDRLARMNNELLKDMHSHRAHAAFLMGEWGAFDQICEDEEVFNRLGPITKAAALVRGGRCNLALQVVTAAKRELFDEFSDAYEDSYVRSYPYLVQMQHLTHIQEVCEYRKTTPERRDELRRLWSKRLSQMLPRPEYWRDVVAINSLVLSQEEDFHSRLEVASLALKTRPTGIGAHILLKLLGTADLTSEDNWRTPNPYLLSAYAQYLYNQGTPELAEKAFTGLASVLVSVLGEKEQENRTAWGDCWLLLGEWSLQRNANRVDALRFLEKAAELNPKSSDAAHFLGRVHQSISASPEYRQDEAQRVVHISAAISSLFTAVQLSENKNSATLNILRVLSLWFANGHHGEVSDVMRSGILSCPNTVWLRVIPQLVARMGIGSRTARQVLTDLLTRVGEAFPQALIYPLTVGERSGVKSKREVAEKALQGIRASQEDLVKDASQISGELVRLAILWGELWVEGISRAAKVANSHQEIIRILQSLFSQLSTPSTPNEVAFVDQYRSHLAAAWNYLNRADTNSAWSYLKKVYAALRKATQDRKLHMSDVSPVLSAMRQSLVAVPGTFRPSGPLITIASFQSRIAVMPSKQKPRRFGLTGSDGLSYRFLLKGHEDLRLDERVMQFINLVNSIFKNDPTSIDLEYTIPSYSVIPLTDNVGIIGWVENTETVFRLLERRRQEQGLSIYQEVMMIVQKEKLANVDDYHKLPKETRIACLDMVMHGSPRNELAKVMWETNSSCELWMDYRKQYAHTAALMSMVGYVLGLGDRHLNNLMLQKGGNLVHIDFGDCFEVAMKRQLYAEAVPFRLTRLMVFALGVSGVDGAYRITCENVMSLLRRNKDNLLAILEAFIYDPLINWSGDLEETKDAKAADPTSPVSDDAPSTFVDLSCSAPTRRRIIGQAMLTDEWAVLSQFIRKGGEGARRSIVLPRGSENVPLEKAVENVRQAVREGNFQLANAWMQQVQKMAPDDCVQSVFEHSIAEKRSLVANSALARVQAKLSGQDFFGTVPPPSIADTTKLIAPFFPYTKRGVDAVPVKSRTHSLIPDDDTSKVASRRSRFHANSDTSGRMHPTSSWFEVEVNHFKSTTWATAKDGKALPQAAEQPLLVKDQVSRLIGEATALENLSESYLTGWAPFW